MNALKDLWRGNPYAVAAVVIAPLVFGLVFAVIWVFARGGDDAATVAQAEEQQARTPVVVQVASGAEQETPAAPAAQSGEAGAAAGTTATQAETNGQSAGGAGAASQESAQPPAEEPAEVEPMPTLEDVLVTAIDDSTFRYGTEAERGAILPIDNGIVPSSGPRHATSWELLLPTARIRADIVSLGRTPSGALGAPDNPFVVGWFHLSANPGEAGNTILAGHRDYEDIDGNIGVGVCWELDRVQVGDQMVIRDAEQSIAWVYEVTESTVVDPSDPASLRYLTHSTEPIITLITCTGSFDSKTHNYSHRLVVVATLQATAST